MERARTTTRGAGCARIATERPELVAARARGPARARPADRRASWPSTTSRARRKGPWWDWSDVKRALEFLFWSGRDHERAAARASSGSTTCPSACSRADVLAAPTPDDDDAQRELIRVAARVAGRRDRARPARLLPAARRRVQAARRRAGRGGRAAAGRRRGLERAGVPGAGRARAARASTPARWSGRSTPLIWERPRVERLFGFRYRIEIYVPERAARARLLRAAVPARRPSSSRASTSRRPRRRARCSSRPRTPSRGRGSASRRSPRRWPSSCADGVVAGARRRDRRGGGRSVAGAAGGACRGAA